MPVFASAREKARETLCMSNTKQIGLASAEYNQDYDEAIVPAGCTVNPCYQRWDNFLYPYIKTYNVFVCPDQPNWGPDFAPPMPGITASDGGGAYGINFNICSGFAWMNGTSLRPYVPFFLSEIPDVSGTFLFAECAQLNDTGANDIVTSPDNHNPQNWNQPQYLSGPSDYQVQPPGNFTGGAANYEADDNSNDTRRPVPRHNNGLNIIYVDGHAKWMQITAFLGPMNQTNCPTSVNGKTEPANQDGWCYGDPHNSWDNL